MGEVWERVLALLVDDSRSTASARIDNRVRLDSHGDDGTRTEIHVGQNGMAWSMRLALRPACG